MEAMEIINRYRRSAGISEKKMAIDLGISERSLRGYFAGETSPKLSFVKNCADYFKVHITEFFGGSVTNTAHVKGRHIEGAKFNYQEFNEPEESYGREEALKNEIKNLREIIASRNELIDLLKSQRNNT